MAAQCPAASGPNTKFPLNPSASDLPAPVASGPNTKFPLNPAASASPTGPNVKFPLNPAASASPNTVLVASPPPAPVSAPAIDSTGPAPVQSAYPCPTPKPQKVTGAVIGLQLQYNATGATTAADGSTSRRLEHPGADVVLHSRGLDRPADRHRGRPVIPRRPAAPAGRWTGRLDVRRLQRKRRVSELRDRRRPAVRCSRSGAPASTRNEVVSPAAQASLVIMGCSNDSRMYSARELTSAFR